MGKERNSMGMHEFLEKHYKSSPFLSLPRCGHQHVHDTYDALKSLEVAQLPLLY